MSRESLLHPHGELSGNEVMIDYLDDNLRRLKRTLSGLTEDGLNWQADAEANSIAVILWHMGRILDVFYTQLTRGFAADQGSWFTGGWAEKTGYDPRGIGRDGWGSVNEYTREEVSAIPQFDLPSLLEFLEGVYGTVRAYLVETSMEGLAKPAYGFEGQFTCYQVISMALMDNVRHLGEIRLIRALWERSQPGL